MTTVFTEASLAATLAGRAMAAAAGSHDWAPVDEGLRALARLNTLAVEADLAVSARRIGSSGGAVALLGTSLCSAPYPALLWNGDRLSRARSGSSAALTLVGLVAGQDDEADASRLVLGVRAGLAIRDARSWPGERANTGPASATTDVICAAACAAVSAEMGFGDVTKVLDLAGSLMLIRPAQSPDSAEMSGQWSGHALAAGWLAVQLHRSGVSGMGGGLQHTLGILAGPRSGGRRGIPTSSDSLEALLRVPPSMLSIRTVIEALQ